MRERALDQSARGSRVVRRQLQVKFEVFHMTMPPVVAAFSRALARICGCHRFFTSVSVRAARPKPGFLIRSFAPHATLAMANSAGSTSLVRAAAAPLDPLVVVHDAVGIPDVRALEEQLRPDAGR
jgi:hypothetical protein